jgi:histidinol dehydrogenase
MVFIWQAHSCVVCRIRLEKRKENELRPLIADTEALARLEGLEGHARAAHHRLALLQ